MTPKEKIILEPNYTIGYNKGKKDERQRIREEIMKIKLKYHTHPTANFSDKLLFGLDEGLSEVLALLSEDGK